MKNTDKVLLYQAIMQSNLHSTTKSFLGQVLKNVNIPAGSYVAGNDTDMRGPLVREDLKQFMKEYGDPNKYRMLDDFNEMSGLGIEENDFDADEGQMLHDLYANEPE